MTVTDLPAAVDRRVLHGLAVLEMAHDVLQYRRVIDHEPDRQRERHQRRLSRL
jgi:hypothetical protein